MEEKVEVMFMQGPPVPDIVQIRKLIVFPEEWDRNIWGDPDNSEPGEYDSLFPSDPPAYEARPIFKTEQSEGP